MEQATTLDTNNFAKFEQERARFNFIRMSQDELVAHIESGCGSQINPNDPTIMNCKRALNDLNGIK